MSEERRTGRGRVLVLADDLTGALEAGAKCASQGIETLVVVEQGEQVPEIRDDISALVLDTETRHVSSDEAARRVCEITKMAGNKGFGTIYKKTDSTLRGNIAAELAGLLKAHPGNGLVYVPAYPKMGRTVKQGVLHVAGKPVSATDFGLDALNPVSESSIAELLKPHIRLPVVTINGEDLRHVNGAAVYVCDAESEEEVWATARLFVESGAFKLVAGPSAFLHHLAREMDLPRHPPSPLPRVGRALIASGSRSKISIDQVRYAKASGFPVIDAADLDNQIGDRYWWILRSNTQVAETSHEAAYKLANQVVGILNAKDLDALVVFGGDTVYAVLRALGKSVAHPIGEALEGIPVSCLERSSADRGESNLVLVTKAGGFGPINVLPMIREVLE